MSDGFFDVEIDDELAGNWALIKTGAFITTIGTSAIYSNRDVLICAAAIGDFFLGTGIDDKLEVTLALGKTWIVTGWNCDFPLSIGLIVKISHGSLVANIVNAVIGDGLFDVEIYVKLENS